MNEFFECFHSKMLTNAFIQSKLDLVKSKIFFFPKEDESLFWCLYIIYKGKEEYYHLNSKDFFKEKNMKINFIEDSRVNKKKTKQAKVSLTHVENNLLNEKNISVSSFVYLCFLYEFPVYLLFEKMYYTNIDFIDKEYDIFFVVQKEKTKWGMREIQKTKHLDFIDEELPLLFKMHTITNPLKPISSYKKKELLTICQEYEINDISDEYDKKKIYEWIQKHFEDKFFQNKENTKKRREYDEY
jgi:hypothetical protein